ncbi:unnamed protein product [Echinostoma caproni]|uniref:SRCR domain-containing protein n=1 Tax=Echinostoma caproni TaxID=27848 RepID=A0A183AJX6_9TREM|nr:unnamed protein product [Echinostoma caproni]
MANSPRGWGGADVPGGVRGCGGAGRNTDGSWQVDGPPSAPQGPCTGVEPPGRCTPESETHQCGTYHGRNDASRICEAVHRSGYCGGANAGSS